MKSLVKMSKAELLWNAHSPASSLQAQLMPLCNLRRRKANSFQNKAAHKPYICCHFFRIINYFPCLNFHQLYRCLKGNHSYNHSKRYLYSVCSMTSKMNKIMKTTNRAPAYFLVKSVRLKMLRGKKGKGKIQFKIG